jgi:hypothetical protein
LDNTGITKTQTACPRASVPVSGAVAMKRGGVSLVSYPHMVVRAEEAQSRVKVIVKKNR